MREILIFAGLLYLLTGASIFCHELDSEDVKCLHVCCEEEAMQCINKLDTAMQYEKGFRMAMDRAWWNVAQALYKKSASNGQDYKSIIQEAVNNYKKRADDLFKNSGDTVQSSSWTQPAFQWAQSPDSIFLNIKFSHRWGSPGALSIFNESVTVDANNFKFSGQSKHSGLIRNYILDLNLYENVENDNIEWSLLSGGHASVTLKKKQLSIWPRLTSNKTKVNNMHIWWEMKEAYYGQNLRFLKEQNGINISKSNDEDDDMLDDEQEGNFEHESDEILSNEESSIEEDNRDNTLDSEL